MGRCHYLRLDSGGFFPEHYDINKLDYDFEDARLIAFVNNCSKDTMKFIYGDEVINVTRNTLLF